ncbi:glycosyltransferase [Desulfocurvus sp. DL9XJH121]
MRIIQVANVRWFNATAWYALYLARLLNEAGHESLVLALPGTETHEKALAWGLDVRTLPLNTASPLALAGLYRDLARLVREFRPQAVNCHRGESFWLWGLLRRRTNAFRLVRTRGDQRPPKGDPVNRWLHRRVADAVVVTNSVMREHFRAAFGLPGDRLACILGGVDRERFAFSAPGRERVRAELGFGPNDVVVGLLGRFDEVKGQRELMHAVARLRAEHGRKDVRLLLAGLPDPTPLETVRGWAREAGVDEATAVVGKRGDVADLISAMDLGVIASKWSETIARAALEIMSCGVPLVGTTVGVMPDLLSPGALFPPADEAAMAETLARTLGPEAREALAGEQARTIGILSGRDFLERTLAVYKGEAI